MTRAEPRPPGWIAGSAGASLGIIGALWGTGAIEPPAIFILLIVPVALGILAIVRSVDYWKRQRDFRSPASRKYVVRFSLASIAYVVGMSLAAIGYDRFDGVPERAALALLPIVPAVAMVFIFRSYLKSESDEFQRYRLQQSTVGGLWFVLLLGVIYGFFQTFLPENLPHIHAWWVLPVWAVGMGLSQLRFDRVAKDES